MSDTAKKILSGGKAGPSGPGILSGAGVPGGNQLATDATDGHFYLDTTATRLYGPKTDGEWGAGVSLVGPAGDDGSDANVTATTVAAAIAAMNAGQKTATLNALGIPSYAGLAAANLALANGDVFIDTSDNNKIKTATN
jgi:hypothetical protein